MEIKTVSLFIYLFQLKFKVRRLLICFLFLSALFTGCHKTSIYDDNILVPATVDKNPWLSQTEIHVGGIKRKIHIQTFGDPKDSVLLIIHGGPGSDFRPFLPLKALSDKYFVIMWDQRGSGLSERIDEKEISLDYFVEEINAIKQKYAPDKKLNIIGQSWGGMLACLYQSKYPHAVNQIVLMEPGPLNSQVRNNFERADKDSGTFISDWYASYTWIHELVELKDHNILDYKMMIAAQTINDKFYCDPVDKSSTPFWRFGGYIAYIAGDILGTIDFDFTTGVKNYHKPILLMGSSCSSMGFGWQSAHNAPLLNNVIVKKVENAGHYFTVEQPDTSISILKSFLENYRK